MKSVARFSGWNICSDFASRSREHGAPNPVSHWSRFSKIAHLAAFLTLGWFGMLKEIWIFPLPQI
jgi:hypothetical protein